MEDENEAMKTIRVWLSPDCAINSTFTNNSLDLMA